MTYDSIANFGSRTLVWCFWSSSKNYSSRALTSPLKKFGKGGFRGICSVGRAEIPLTHFCQERSAATLSMKFNLTGSIPSSLLHKRAFESSRSPSFRMLVAGIQAENWLDPRLKHSG